MRVPGCQMRKLRSSILFWWEGAPSVKPSAEQLHALSTHDALVQPAVLRHQTGLHEEDCPAAAASAMCCLHLTRLLSCGRVGKQRARYWPAQSEAAQKVSARSRLPCCLYCTALISFQKDAAVRQDGDAESLVAAGASKGGSWMDTILNLIPGRRAAASSEPSEEAIKRTHDTLRFLLSPRCRPHDSSVCCDDSGSVQVFVFGLKRLQMLEERPLGHHLIYR